MFSPLAAMVDKKVFATLFAAIFAAITGVGLVVPLLPVYATGLGASGFLIGMIFGSFSISRTVLLPVFGKLSDKKGRKPFIVSGLFFYALTSVAFAHCASVEGLIVIRFFQGAASALILPVVQAYVGDITPPGREGFIMGLFNISMYASLSLGPVLGGVVKDYWGLDSSFAIMGILSVAAFALAACYLPSVDKEPRTEKDRDPMDYRALIQRRLIKGLFFFRFAYTICIGVIWAFLPVLAHDKFKLSSSEIGFLIMLGVLVAGVMQTPMGKLADKWNKSALVAVGGLIMAGAVFSFYRATGFWFLFFANTAFGIGGGIGVPALMALSVVEGKSTGSMGSVMGLLTMGHSLGMLAGALGAGLIKDAIGLEHAYFFGAAVMLAGAFAFLFLARPGPGADPGPDKA